MFNKLSPARQQLPQLRAERGKKIMITKLLLILAAAAAAAAAGVILVSRQEKQAGEQPQTEETMKTETIKLSSKETMGNFLVDAKGMTLYYFPKDVPGKSNCYDQCAAAWPIFYVQDITAGQGLDKSDFGTITRNDGGKQTTYKNWPLYYYFKDANPGDTLGEGVGNVWYIAKVPFYTVLTANKEGHGNYLVDEAGRALYLFTLDQKGTLTQVPKSNCVNSCLALWPVFNVGNIIAPSLLKASDFSALTRTDGQKQLVYQGSPLYYYVNDTAPGDTKGEGINNVWFTVSIK